MVRIFVFSLGFIAKIVEVVFSVFGLIGAIIGAGIALALFIIIGAGLAVIISFFLVLFG